MGDVFGKYSWAVRTYECGPDGVASNTDRAAVLGDEPFIKLRWDCREASHTAGEAI